MNNNPKKLFNTTDSTNQYIEELLKEADKDDKDDKNDKYVHHIFSVSSECDNKKTKINTIIIDQCKSDQFGFTWFMIGTKDSGENECITVGQAQKNRINDEINAIYNALIGHGKNGKDNPYYQIKNQYQEISVYQVDIDDYLNTKWDKDKESLKDIAYNLIKDYFTEVLLAHNTSSQYWDYYGSGMDKRFLFYLVENYGKEFHCNRIKGDDN